MQEDLYSHPLVKPLLHTGPDVPKESIERLAKEIRKNKALGRRCMKLFRFEAAFQCTPNSYISVWLAFSLALAEFDEAIDLFIDLFELVDPVEHDMLWELAQFALWQYGDAAVRAVTEDFWRVVEVDHTGYYLGVLEVVESSQDQLLRKRVANLVIEALKSPKTSPAALMGLVDLALILRDPRLPEIMDLWKAHVTANERRVLSEVEEILLGADPEMRNDEFRLPWTDLAEFSAEHFLIHFENTDPTYRPDRVPENICREFRSMAESFRTSPRFQELPPKLRANPDAVVDQLTRIFNLLFGSFGTLPEEADAEEIAGLMKEVLPKQLVGDPSVFKPIPQILIAFFRYLTDSYSREEGEEYAFFIRSSEEEMLRRAADPAFWDNAKTLAMERLNQKI
ncbi:MAG: hypothetical protein ACYTG7_18415 [Planctomycetota bacterium]|jgi:hypothetical protein